MERFIHTRFAQIYGADVRWFMPFLLYLAHLGEGHALAAMGYRFADCGPLFLESYLDAPVEVVLGRPRSEIIELGNLAAAQPGMLRWMILVLEAFLRELGGTQVVFTGTTSLANSFRRMGVRLTPLAEADPARIPDARRYWGSYYEHRPMVFVGTLDTDRAGRERETTDADHREVTHARHEACRLARCQQIREPIGGNAR